MAELEQIERLTRSIDEWNQWRREHPEIRLDLSDADLSGADLSGADLSRAMPDIFERFSAKSNLPLLNKPSMANCTNLRGANLSKARLDDADLSYADLSGVNLKNANLMRANLSHANLSNTDLTGADLSNTDLTGADLTRANFTSHSLTGASFTSLGAAILNRANLNHTSLVMANLRHANLSNASLFMAELSYADLSDADLSGANLSHAKLSRYSSTIGLGDFDDTSLRGANLSKARFDDADLSHADLSGAKLKNANLMRANLIYAILSNTDLIGADLSGANLTGADLSGADLTGANLSGANLNSVNLNGTILTEVHFIRTIFAWVDVSKAKDLETAIHEGPSTININSVILPHDEFARKHFLRGIGFTETQIEYLPSLLTPRPIQYHSLFISYASQDEVIAQQLHTHLRKNDVPCWFAPHDLQPGNYFRERIDQAIYMQDKVLLLLSEHSVKSGWVRYEVELALARENRAQREILFPVRLDDAIFHCTASWATSLQKTRHIGNFTDWQDDETYRLAFTALLRHLKVTKPPTV